jgi:hypothetical protein
MISLAIIVSPLFGHPDLELRQNGIHRGAIGADRAATVQGWLSVCDCFAPASPTTKKAITQADNSSFF